MPDKDFEIHRITSKGESVGAPDDGSEFRILSVTDNLGQNVPLEFQGSHLNVAGQHALIQYAAEVAPPEIYRTHEARVNRINQRNIQLGITVDARWRKSLHDLGALGSSWEDEWFTNFHLMAIAEEYSLPVALYNLGSHWGLILTRPTKVDGGWKTIMWNPMGSGEYEYVIPDKYFSTNGSDGHQVVIGLPKHVQNDTNWRDIHSPPTDNDFLVTAVSGSANEDSQAVLAAFDKLDAVAGTYDLRLSDPFLYATVLHEAKNAHLQTKDAFRCGSLSLVRAAIGYAVRSGENIFKKEGLRKLSFDSGMYLVTPEDEIVIASDSVSMMSSPWLVDVKL